MSEERAGLFHVVVVSPLVAIMKDQALKTTYVSGEVTDKWWKLYLILLSLLETQKMAARGRGAEEGPPIYQTPLASKHNRGFYQNPWVE
ncbi:hypothetical protein EMCRGX_G032747 [Ephydatia muelleri]